MGVSLMVTVVGTVISVLTMYSAAYALSKPDFPFRRGIMIFFIITMVFSAGMVPNYIVVKTLGLTRTPWALILPSVVQVYNMILIKSYLEGVPKELEESAYIDGSGVFRTFFTIILPLSIPMMVTVFLFAFCWQWTDDFYTELFFTTSKITLMPDIVEIPTSLKTDYAGQNMYYTAIRNTCGICIILPLVVLYCFGQNFLVQGIERSGLTAE
jgi:ABC-type glycerol-3-phosphate transport system permease component